MRSPIWSLLTLAGLALAAPAQAQPPFGPIIDPVYGQQSLQTVLGTYLWTLDTAFQYKLTLQVNGPIYYTNDGSGNIPHLPLRATFNFPNGQLWAVGTGDATFDYTFPGTAARYVNLIVPVTSTDRLQVYGDLGTPSSAGNAQWQQTNVTVGGYGAPDGRIVAWTAHKGTVVGPPPGHR